MCAVIGIVLEKPNNKDFENIKSIFIESKIRGMHATGMSFLPSWSDTVVTIKEPKSAEYFVNEHLQNLNDLLSDDGNLYLVGHCRYSTSDLEYNQPISNDQVSIVHNGVISQELPENWEDMYGYKCETKNDSELLLHTIEDGVSPLDRWSDASLSVVELYLNKRIRAYRNGKRPIYLTSVKNGFIITSTENIVKRVGLYGSTVEIKPYEYANILDPFTVAYETVDKPNDFRDLQR